MLFNFEYEKRKHDPFGLGDHLRNVECAGSCAWEGHVSIILIVVPESCSATVAN